MALVDILSDTNAWFMNCRPICVSIAFTMCSSGFLQTGVEVVILCIENVVFHILFTEVLVLRSALGKHEFTFLYNLVS